ncbi:deoxyribose-phosphate aldolase [Aneurinibacillus sp. Ricciae_BoGa-3]|uniref:deoxyribose-phosphate aldolase n=1 Tax=Aneurinibacillus sp. Ricciae_BoGa-3 TaxID=3022697 RepID=UPI00234186F7|nr:deoxyribose-phosphate aldolase [Aneurinibacillus sp. Ricciae_BoGa-3]WCK56295.1 deoxyribose-phosphate aldolase [Aneurinibacillus sp. Ricciae_BoGa-3]
MNEIKSLKEIAKMIDHTILKPEATEDEVIQVCNEAKTFGFATVCINPVWVPFVSKELNGSNIGITTVIGFPFGAGTTLIKAMETRDAIANGATEIDMVINIGDLKSGKMDSVKRDIRMVVEAAGEKTVKVILETCLLTDEEKVIGCKLSKEAGADFVKTSTGFSKAGATVADVSLMRKIVGLEFGVKASGGIRTLNDVKAMIKAGASRIGASASVAFVKDADGIETVY